MGDFRRQAITQQADIIDALNELVVELTKHADALAEAVVELLNNNDPDVLRYESLVDDYQNFIREA